MPTDYDEYSDAQLVRSYQKGEREAGDALFRRYERSLRRFLKQKTRNRENVEDFVQDTCAQLHLFPHPETQKTLDILLERRATEYPRGTKLVR